MYVLPLGLAGLSPCQWILEVPHSLDLTQNWEVLGLVDLHNPDIVASVIHSCDAALVAKPRSHNAADGPPIVGTISFLHLDGEQSILAAIPFYLEADRLCAEPSSLTCHLTTL